MWTITAALVGAGLGYLLMRNLATLRYRVGEETELPVPRHAWRLIPSLAAAWGILTWRHLDTAWPTLAMWLPLTAALGWLSAVDLDVQRLPDRILIPSAGWVATVLTVDTISTGNATPALIAVGIGLASFLAAWLLHHVSRGDFGFGDVKLVALLSSAVAARMSELVLPYLLGSCLVAIATALNIRRQHLAFGPALALGATVSMGLG